MFIVLLCALLLDYLFAEPQKYHPLVGFGRIAQQLEIRLNEGRAEQKRVNGFLAVLLCLLPAWWLTDMITVDNALGMAIEIIILYLALGLNSLKEHAKRILEPLKNDQIEQARQALSMVVSRDTEQLDSDGVAKAATESVLENGNDAVFATIFWFVIAGAPGVVVYRLANTLDAMWGYKTERYSDFGFFVAKLDDLLNYIPARLTALVYALMGHWQNAIKCSFSQGSLWDSPNAGVVMAAGAGALGIQLGGGDYYHGEYKERPELGCGHKASTDSIRQACELVDRSTVFWLIAVGVITLISWQ